MTIWKCEDCKKPISSEDGYEEGDVCSECFDAFGGMPEEDMVQSVYEDFMQAKERLGL